MCFTSYDVWINNHASKELAGSSSKSKKREKVTFLYSAVSRPLDRSKHFTLHSLADLFIPTPTRLLREAFSHAPITCKDHSLTFPFSTTVYSQLLIYTSWREQWARFEMVAKVNRTRSFDWESGILPLSYCAPQTKMDMRTNGV